MLNFCHIIWTYRLTWTYVIYPRLLWLFVDSHNLRSKRNWVKQMSGFGARISYDFFWAIIFHCWALYLTIVHCFTRHECRPCNECMRLLLILHIFDTRGYWSKKKTTINLPYVKWRLFQPDAVWKFATCYKWQTKWILKPYNIAHPTMMNNCNMYECLQRTE